MLKKSFLVLGLLALFATGCSSNNYNNGTYAGEWERESYGTLFTAKVSIEIKNDKIVSVSLDENSNITSPAAQWTNDSVWFDNYEDLLASFEGLEVEDVLQATADISAPSVTGVDKITGATLSSARLLLAIQNGLNKAKVDTNTKS
ncbi:MAG: FMN-binding protein [Bacilli bacterium]|nr:FMN-binding protein [Bacilli bacterium]